MACTYVPTFGVSNENANDCLLPIVIAIIVLSFADNMYLDILLICVATCILYAVS